MARWTTQGIIVMLLSYLAWAQQADRQYCLELIDRLGDKPPEQLAKPKLLDPWLNPGKFGGL